ncbi:hypothetical protein A3D03_04305 [Candidatus Gottesmanbacteria bacterium RIFCSPHIGHO2_02_FULL_40_13]|uniref:Antitoxin n=1 Tax=Candidatus Gottesmanbacteria bacterium RIFCSPHIGHO2_02_FULL_40_13 TaxID=1798384 RepID=A0A1F6A869_9BACT|nr:MAG: hypothetical protein A3D03_04305 [Candidatus Gottesmanbacteria bacterium RIFCSPHIGHO2_02_FULL_40_13]
MKSITIHGIDDELDWMLQKKARGEDLSLNKTIKKLLKQSLGLSETKKTRPKHDFSEFCGVWSEKEYKEFEKNTEIFEKIDEEDWK